MTNYSASLNVCLSTDIVANLIQNCRKDPSYHNYVQYISSDSNKLERLIEQFPASLLFNNPLLLRSTALSIVNELQKNQHLKTLQKTEIYFKIKCPNRYHVTDIKWWRKKLNKFARQHYESIQIHCHNVSKHKDKYISKVQEINFRTRMKATAKWMKETFVKVGDQRLTLAECSRSNYARFSEMYTILKGLNNYSESIDYDWALITITAPPEFHPTPQNGNSKWNKCLPIDTHLFLINQWHKVQSLLYGKKIHHFGIRVVEPHQDETPHYHVMVWHKKEDFDVIAKAVKRHFSGENQVHFRRNNGSSLASSYICKYIIKSIDIDEDEDTKKVCAWRATWGIRAFQFFGIKSQITKWRELRRIKHDNSALWRAANSGDFASYFSLLQTDKSSLLKQTVTNKFGKQYQKIIGISINDIFHITHSKHRVLTNDPDLNTVAFRLNYSSNKENITSDSKLLLTRIKAPPTQ